MSQYKKADLKTKLISVPAEPGCYLWLGEKEEKENEETRQVLYAGKAKNLKNRIRQYLNSDEYKTRFLMSKVADLDWIVTSSELEALLLESNLIKKYNPVYNVRLKDDKRYPYICLTMGEAYPRLFITRRKTNLNHAYFGPFSDVKAARNTLALVNKIFPVRKRSLKFPLSKPRKPCLNYHLKRCWAPCAGNVDEREYQNMTLQIKEFLEGKSQTVQENLKKQMNNYSENLDFEKAARARDILKDIEITLQGQTVHEENERHNYDIAGLVLLSRKEIEQELKTRLDYFSTGSKDNNELIFFAQIVILKIRNGNLTGKENYALSEASYLNYSNDSADFHKEPAEELYAEYLEAFFFDYYMRLIDYPDTIFISHKMPNAKQWENALKNKTGQKIKIKTNRSLRSIHPQYKQIENLFKMALTNARLSLNERILSENIQNKRRGLRQLYSLLKLSKIPETIECYDISNLFGQEPVAAGVMFKNGLPHKPGYRKYKIKTVEGINDPAMIHETISRRLRKLKETNEKPPDLIVIDGGITQLKAALKARSECGISVPVISLAKKEEEIYLESNHKLKMDKNSPGMLILRHARDEAHRFCLSYHRSLRLKKNLTSTLNQIPGIAEKTAKNLMATLRKIDFFETNKTALSNRLLSVKGVNKKISDAVIKIFFEDNS
ncbi:MAG: excinuclease ABC subunit UvrC [Spirochaetia bacterium]|nr:excinuclease ABC subunit UvrC [Spirochaetia bacterium]